MSNWCWFPAVLVCELVLANQQAGVVPQASDAVVESVGYGYLRMIYEPPKGLTDVVITPDVGMEENLRALRRLVERLSKARLKTLKQTTSGDQVSAVARKQIEDRSGDAWVAYSASPCRTLDVWGNQESVAAIRTEVFLVGEWMRRLGYAYDSHSLQRCRRAAALGCLVFGGEPVSLDSGFASPAGAVDRGGLVGKFQVAFGELVDAESQDRQSAVLGLLKHWRPMAVPRSFSVPVSKGNLDLGVQVTGNVVAWETNWRLAGDLLNAARAMDVEFGREFGAEVTQRLEGVRVLSKALLDIRAATQDGIALKEVDIKAVRRSLGAPDDVQVIVGKDQHWCLVPTIQDTGKGAMKAKQVVYAWQRVTVDLPPGFVR